MGKRLVGLRHPVHVFLSLEGRTFVVVGGHDLCSQFLRHGVTATFAGEDNHIHDANERLNLEHFKKQVEIYIEAIRNLNEIED